MGVFSWITSDTKESVGVSDERDPVYLLSPNGEKYREDFYEGYGVFGGMDVYEQLALWNASILGMNAWVEAADYDERRYLGIFLELGCVFRDSNNELWTVCTRDYPFLRERNVRRACGNYSEPAAPGYGTPNELTSSGEWTSLGVAEALNLNLHKVKIVTDPSFDYSDVGNSEICPNQGLVEY